MHKEEVKPRKNRPREPSVRGFVRTDQQWFEKLVDGETFGAGGASVVNCCGESRARTSAVTVNTPS